MSDTPHAGFATRNQNRAADALRRISYRIGQWFPQEMARIVVEEFGRELDTVAMESAHIAAQIAVGENPQSPGLGETAYAIYSDIIRACGACVAGVEVGPKGTEP